MRYKFHSGERQVNYLELIDKIVWGIPLILLLLGTGLYLTIKLRFLQFRILIPSLKLALIERKEKEKAEGDISHFQALMTALSATVGTGNIVGVATAISIGGPGAMFWIWMTGLVGMVTKYAEALLAVKYRTTNKYGEMCGGPMYYIPEGTKIKLLGVLFALFASVAAFGIGNMVQANSIAEAINSTWKLDTKITGTILAFLTGLVIIGGIKSIAKTASFLAPFMIIVYVLAGLTVIFSNVKNLQQAFFLILKNAFTPAGACGGFVGAGIMTTIRYGVARGLFSNESGLGSSPIAAAAAITKNPFRQAIVSMTQTFIDTIVVCSITGLVIISTGAWCSDQTGVNLTIEGMETIFKSFGNKIVSISLILFAFSTILGWCYYGEKSIEYLLGEKARKPYRILWTIMAFFGSISRLETIWILADIMNGFMAFPNLIGLISLRKVIAEETRNGGLEKRGKILDRN